MAGGLNHKLLEVELSSNSIREIPLPGDVLREFIGGRGLGVWLLWREFRDSWGALDPLSPENPLMILTGPLTGYYPGVRVCVTGKSPLSNGVVGSTIASEVGIELKASGYDGLVVRGKAKDPVYIFINDDNVEVRSAERVWGKKGRDVTLYLVKETWNELRGRSVPKEPAILYIGPAGENKVRFANVMSKWTHAAGYGGYGAVMGSKNLKAIVVKGSGPLPPIDNTEKFEALFEKVIAELISRNVLMRKWGTIQETWLTAHNWSSTPVKNWAEEYYEDPAYTHVSAEMKLWVKKCWCDYGCPTGCMKISKVVRGGEVAITDGPDYELNSYLGPNLGVFDIQDNTYLVYLADEYGLDGIALGNVLGFAAELYEKGVLTERDLGFRLRWGDTDAFANLIRNIANRKGIGNVLAEGTFRAALELSRIKGVDVLKYAVVVKGIAVGAHGVRSGLDYPQSISYALSTQGGDHTSVALLPKGHPWGELWTIFIDSALACLFNITADLEVMTDFMNAVTGWNITLSEWFDLIAPRILTVQRILLLLGGPDVKWDPRIYDDNPLKFYEPLPSGPKKNFAVDRNMFEDMKKKYYETLGWDELGIPTEDTLRRLGLEELTSAVRKLRQDLA